MRGVRFVKKEQSYLVALLSPGSCDHNDKLDAAILTKLEAANGPEQAKGLSVGPLESALVLAARGKVVPALAGGYARLSRQSLLVGATVEAMGEIGNWLSRQRWLTEPITIQMVLNKWHEWLPRARATAAPKGTTEGLGNAEAPDLGQGTSRGSKAPTQGRTTQGFR